MITFSEVELRQVEDEETDIHLENLLIRKGVGVLDDAVLGGVDGKC